MGGSFAPGLEGTDSPPAGDSSEPPGTDVEREGDGSDGATSGNDVSGNQYEKTEGHDIRGPLGSLFAENDDPERVDDDEQPKQCIVE